MSLPRSDSPPLVLADIIRRPEFVRKYPYYAGVLSRLELLEDPAVDVMGVSAHGRRLYLHVNLAFFQRAPESLTGVLLHEVHHVVLGHVTAGKFQDAAHPDLLQLAMEMSANEFIREPLPGAPVVWNDFREYGINARQSTLERYRLLVAARQKGHVVPVPEPLDDHLPAGVGQAAGASKCEPHARLPQLIADAFTEAECLVQRVTDATPTIAGCAPGRILEQLQAPEQPPPRAPDWETALQQFVAQLRAPQHTYTRPNRRAPGWIGVIPGKSYSALRGERPRLVVAIDTSASMSTAELVDIAGQLQLLHGLIDITVAECDTIIQRCYRFTGRLDNVQGRGGTDLRPVFEAEFLGEHRPNGVIYFTDGEGPYPADDPGLPTLWVLTKPRAFACAWGRQAVLRRGEFELRPVA